MVASLAFLTTANLSSNGLIGLEENKFKIYHFYNFLLLAHWLHSKQYTYIFIKKDHKKLHY